MTRWLSVSASEDERDVSKLNVFDEKQEEIVPQWVALTFQIGYSFPNGPQQKMQHRDGAVNEKMTDKRLANTSTEEDEQEEDEMRHRNTI